MPLTPLELTALNTTSVTTTVYSPTEGAPPPRRVRVITFADRHTVYLHALASSVWHFNDGACMAPGRLRARGR